MITRLNYSGKAVKNFEFFDGLSTKYRRVFGGDKTESFDERKSINRIAKSVSRQYRKAFETVKSISVYSNGYDGVTVIVDLYE